jgi:thiamine pyrophosphokinase
MIIDDYSEIELVASRVDKNGINIAGMAEVPYDYPYFSLLATEGEARGVTIRNAKFPLDDGTISPGYQYATSNEALPGKTAEIEVKNGRLLLIKIVPGAAERHTEK